MKLQDILSLPYSEQIVKLSTDTTHKGLDEETIKREPELWWKEYEGDHAILRDPDMADKTVGEGDNARFVKKWKIPLSFQKKITDLAVQFLFGESPRRILKNTEDNYKEPFNAFEDLWKNKKLDYFTTDLMRKICIETKAAELWYTTEDSEGQVKIGVQCLCWKYGDEIYAHFDETGDLDAFVRKYKSDGIEHVDIYTAQNYYLGSKPQAYWIVEKKVNPFGKIPVIYYQQDHPEWFYVARAIERAEYMVSRFGNVNDYYSSPILETWGEFLTMPDKTQDNKTLQIKTTLDNNGIPQKAGGAEYLVWEHTPESVRMEYDIVKDLIYSLSSTPDISFNNIKGISQVSGVTLELMFLDAVLKSRGKREIYGEAMTRRINLMKRILSVTNLKNKALYDTMDIDISWGGVLPKDVQGIIAALNVATGGKQILSQETAVKYEPHVTNPDEELVLIQEEESKEPLLGGGSLNF